MACSTRLISRTSMARSRGAFVNAGVTRYQWPSNMPVVAAPSTAADRSTGAAPPQMAPLDLRTVVTEAVGRVQPQVQLKEGRLRLELAEAPLPVLGDSERLGTAVDNLLQNAVKFSTGPPQIEVVGHRENGRIHLVVRDHGIGIPEAARRHLFEKFYRVHNPQLQNVAGTGIGLYLG